MKTLKPFLTSTLRDLGADSLNLLNDALYEVLGCDLEYQNYGQQEGDWEVRLYDHDATSDKCFAHREPLQLSTTIEDVILTACRIKREAETRWSGKA
jgi:hypothetical protein